MAGTPSEQKPAGVKTPGKGVPQEHDEIITLRKEIKADLATIREEVKTALKEIKADLTAIREEVKTAGADAKAANDQGNDIVSRLKLIGPDAKAANDQSGTIIEMLKVKRFNERLKAKGFR